VSPMVDADVLECNVLEAIEPATLETPVITRPSERTRARKGVATPARRPKLSREDRELSLLENRWKKGLDWPVVLWIGSLHAGALAAPFFFTWQGALVGIALAFITGCLGVTLGYHRCLTHGSFSTYRPVRWLLAFVGGLAGEGTALTWVSVHRKHHVFSDQEGDPHTPREGLVWSHMLWFMPNFGGQYHKKLVDRYAPDLGKDPVMRFLDKTFLLWHFVLGLALFGVGYFFWDTYTAWSLVIYGMFVRFMYVLHVTWFVNSATHKWGYRNYETDDDSRNLWWVGLLAYGEGWHNNHHAHQRMARHGHRWWEFDITYYVIRAMEKVGLAWHVVHTPEGRST